MHMEVIDVNLNCCVFFPQKVIFRIILILWTVILFLKVLNYFRRMFVFLCRPRSISDADELHAIFLLMVTIKTSFTVGWKLLRVV